MPSRRGPDGGAPGVHPAGSRPDVKRPLVRITTGALRGRRKKTVEGTYYYSFTGVPYAAPPLGELRFKAPLPARPWSGVRDATWYGCMAMQPLFVPPMGPNSWEWEDVVAFIRSIPDLLRVALQAVFRMEEDCLFANVYTPQLPDGDRIPKMPVLVFVHGGAFRLGNGNDSLYGPDYLMDIGNIVLVTFNYRLGPFGFLAVGTEEAAGNAGLKDQVMLLRWVRDNIAAFGGDPDNVTLAGESTGGVSAHLHMMSPLSRGLFHRIIASSGMAHCDWAFEENPLNHARSFGSALGIANDDMEDPDDLVRRLRVMPAKTLNRQFEITRSIFTPHLTLGMVFVPVIEPPLEGAFLTEDPVTVLAEGRQMDVPVMTGGNSREGLLVFLGIADGVMGCKNKQKQREFMAECMRHSPECYLPNDLFHGLGSDKEALGTEILRHYFGEDGLGLDKFDQFIDMYGDLMFVLPVLKMSRLQAATSKSPVYHYFFAYDGRLGLFKTLLHLESYSGASHADDLGYLFRPVVLGTSHRKPRRQDAVCKEIILRMWTSFVQTGVPSLPESAKESGVSWTPRTEHSFRYLHISENLSMRTGELDARFKFWNDIYKKHLNMALF